MLDLGVQPFHKVHALGVVWVYGLGFLPMYS